jgi:hypothetical protein
MDNKRKTARSPLQVRIRIEHPRHGELMVSTRDISDSGVFVVMDDAQSLLQLGERIKGQVQGLPIEAPVVEMEVVRLESCGMGLIFRRED